MAEGTVLTRVTGPSTSGRSRALAASTTVPPRLSGAKISKTDRSKQTDVEASTAAISPSENSSRAQSMRATALRCSTATALGRPVEPEV
jgi:hypothetical protein